MKSVILKKSVILNVWVTAMLLSLTFINCMGQEGELRAGAAQVSVTPTKKQLRDRVVHDSLYAKSIVLDNGIEKIAFTIVDTQGIPQFMTDEAKKAISAATQIPFENVLIAATHTHSGLIPATALTTYAKDGKFTSYQRIMIDGIIESVKKANDNLVAAKVGWGSVDKPAHVFNRRWYMKNPVISPYGMPDSVKMNPAYRDEDLLEPAGPIDPEVFFIALKSLADEPIAILANYSLHYVGGIENNAVSADYFGRFGEELTALLSAKSKEVPFVGIMSNGTSADINNLDRSREKEVLNPYEKIQIVSADIAASVAEAYEKITFHNWVPLNTTNSSLTIQTRKPSTTLLSNVEKVNQNQSQATLFNVQENSYSKRIRLYMKSYPEEVSISLQAIQIGDIGISAIPFEVFAETGLELKEKNPFKYSFTISHANGRWGYLPTPEQHKKGGYETWIPLNRVQEDASTLIVDQLLKQLQSLKN